MIKTKKITIIDCVVIACICFSAFASLSSESVNKIALYFAIPLAFVLTIISSAKIYLNRYFKLLICLLVWVALSYFWARYKLSAARGITQLLGTFLLSYIFLANSRKEKIISWFYFTYILLFVFAFIYAKNNIMQMIDDENFRLDDEKLNANTMAYYTFYLTFAIYMLSEIFYNKFVKKLFRILFILTIPLSFWIALLTASRQVLIIQLPLILILLFLRYIKGNTKGKKAIIIIIAAIVVGISIPIALETYNDSYLKVRSETSLKDDSRFRLLKEAVYVGFQAFPLGVGAKNFQHYSSDGGFSHNNYAELFANEGIIGVTLYILLMYVFIKNQWLRYKKYKDKNLLAFLVFGIFYVVDGFFYAFYDQLWLMGFFILVSSHSETYYRNHYYLQ